MNTFSANLSQFGMQQICIFIQSQRLVIHAVLDIFYSGSATALILADTFNLGLV